MEAIACSRKYGLINDIANSDSNVIHSLLTTLVKGLRTRTLQIQTDRFFQGLT